MSKVETNLFLKKQKNLDDNYKEIVDSVDLFVNDLTFWLIDITRENLISKLYLLSEKSLLGRKDEETFETCKGLFESYEEALNIYNLNKSLIVSDEKKIILEGLESVLTSQISNFLEDADFMGENPIHNEKEKIIKSFVLEFNEKYNKYIKRYFEYNIQELTNKITDMFLNDKDTFADINKLIIDDINEKFVPLVYDEFSEISNKCIFNLNDLSKRGVTTKFFEVIKLEHEILSSIIKIQVVPLEKLNINSDKESEVINKVLSVLREAYQFIGKNVDELTTSLSEVDTNKTFKNDTLEEFKEENFNILVDSNLKDNFTLSEFIIDFNKEIEDFYLLLRDEIIFFTKRALKEEAMVLKDVYREIAFDVNKLSKEILKGIKVLVYYYEREKAEFPKEDELKIINGINETMEIKIESILENNLSFSEGIIGFLSGFNNIELEFSEEEKEMLVVEAKKIWIENYFIYEEELFGKALKALDNSEIFMKVSIKYNKLLLDKKNKIEKYIIGHKRNNVLYEMVTFEEIEKYSIKILMDSNDLSVLRYLKIFYKVHSYLNKVLLNNNIERIRPKPHDMFNSLEHEALLAEKNDGYEKGQVIKVTNNGYKEGNIIYLRANVIAAK